MPDVKLADKNLVMRLIPGKEAAEALDDPAKMQAFYDEVRAVLAIAPQPDDDDDVDDPEPDRYAEDDKSDEEEDPTRDGAGAVADAPRSGGA